MHGFNFFSEKSGSFFFSLQLLNVDWDAPFKVVLLLGLDVVLVRGDALVGLVVEHGVTLSLKRYGFSALEMRISFLYVTEKS